MAKKLSSAKAREILRDGTAQGHPLTRKQKRFFGAVAGGETPYSRLRRQGARGSR